MRLIADRVALSPTDLANFLACRHTTTLELEAARGLRTRPTYSDPLADLLRERGQEHERRYVESLRTNGLGVEELTLASGTPRPPLAERVATTVDAMRRGVDVIVQAPLGNDTWSGYREMAG